MTSFTLYVLRAHHQARARMLTSDEPTEDHRLRDYRECPAGGEQDIIRDVERHELLLDTDNPNLPDLYGRIGDACPEFGSKRSYHLYWKNSKTSIMPVTNLITYVSMVSMMATDNRELFLVARAWAGRWLEDPRAQYTAVPEDLALVNMVAPPRSVYTVPQELRVAVVTAAGRVETSRTYSPPRDAKERVSKTKDKSPKPAKTKKNK